MTIKIGLVGAGFIGLLHARNLSASPLFELTVVAEPNEATANRVAQETGARVVADWTELVDDPLLDAVLLASPAELHADQVVAFADAGKHILCEKPLALNLEDADRAVAAAQEAGVLLQVDFNRRLDPHHAVLRTAVEEGRVGAPTIVNIISRDPGLPGPDYRRGPGKMFMDTTIHDFDMARFLAGSEITEVSALSAATIDELAREADDADTTVVALRFANGALGIIDNSRQARYGYDQRAEVLGTEGMATCGNVQDTVTAVATASGFASPALPTFFPERYAESFRLAVERFAASIVDGAPLPSDGRDGRAAIAVALAAETSRRERRVVSL
ncbi:MAG: Gfo/Idh/MocA family oxidoreductase [Actinobacteria bacterium]|nr:Gfo/Idh/MocA family oxidoreductase [Actinomycetota bacterium]